MANVPSNLIPSRISQLPEAPNADPAGYFPITISGTTYKVQFSQMMSNIEVPASRRVNAGTGLTGGGSLSADITIAVANGGIGDQQLDVTGVSAGTYGSGANVPVITVNTKGRVTSLSTTPLVSSGYVPDSRQIVAGTGLSGGGNLSADRTLAIDFSSATPQPLGSASAGTGLKSAREDHVHPAVDLADATETSGILPLSRGGTAANLSPIAGAVIYSTGSQFAMTTVGTTDQVLASTGTGAPIWKTLTGAGTVTSVSGSGGTTGLTVSGSPITTTGTLTLGGTLSISAGGTGLSGTPTNGQLLIGNGSGYTLAGLTAGTAISVTNAAGSISIANTAPDQTVTLTNGTAISVTGTYPSFTVTNTAPDQTVTLTSGTNISVTGTYPSFSIANTSTADVVGPAGATSGAISLFDGGTGKLLKNSVITINASGVISNVNTPNTGTDAANKQYVDDLASTGLHYHEAVVLSTSPGSSRTDTYNNGTAGVSATLTSVAAGTLVIDGTVATSTIRVLIQDCSNPIGNGVYVVTNPGSTVAQYVMTRSSDADTYIEQSTVGLDAGSYFFTTGGTNNKGAAWVNTNSGTISFGSTAITFSLFSNSQVYTAGNGLSLTATTFSLDTPVGVLNGGTGQSSAPTNGQLLIGNGSNYTLASLTAGSGVTVTNATGSITIAATGTGGTVTSIDVSGGITGLTFSGGPVTGSGTITMAGTLAITNGGTGASTQSGARTALGLGTMAVQDANSVSITGGSIGSSVLVNLTNSTGTISGGTY
jgi:hypothetical protein